MRDVRNEAPHVVVVDVSPHANVMPRSQNFPPLPQILPPTNSNNSDLWADPVPFDPSCMSFTPPPNSPTPKTNQPSPPPSPLLLSPPTPTTPFPNSLSPITPNCSSPPFTMNDSYILNPDNTFVLPLIFLNNTYVFDMNKLTS